MTPAGIETATFRYVAQHLTVLSNVSYFCLVWSFSVEEFLRQVKCKYECHSVFNWFFLSLTLPSHIQSGQPLLKRTFFFVKYCTVKMLLNTRNEAWQICIHLFNFPCLQLYRFSAELLLAILCYFFSVGRFSFCYAPQTKQWALHFYLPHIHSLTHYNMPSPRHVIAWESTWVEIQNACGVVRSDICR